MNKHQCKPPKTGKEQLNSATIEVILVVILSTLVGILLTKI